MSATQAYGGPTGGYKPIEAARRRHAPVPRDKWPWWAQAMALVRSDGDAGVGDTIHRRIGPATSEAYARWHKETFKVPCGCAERRRQYNEQYPYERTTT